MNKKILTCFAVALMGLFVLSGCNTDPIIATVNGADIHNSEFREIFDSYATYYGIDDATSEENADAVAYLRDMILDRLIDEKVQLIKARELGLDQLTDEMKVEIQTELDATMDNLNAYAQSQALSEEPTLAGDALTARTEELVSNYLEEAGYTLDRLEEEYTNQYIMNRLYDETTSDITVSEEDVRSTYDTRVAQVAAIYDQDPTAFELDFYNAVTLYTIPAGYRHVKHILIALPSETIEQISVLREAGEDDAADAVRDVALESIQEEAGTVLSLLDPDGENFDEIMDLYSDDGDSTTLPNGYAVCKDGQFIDEFTDACFAIRKPQTLSGLVVSDNGYHIIFYIETLEAGDVPYEDLHDAIETELLSTAREDAYAQLCADWRSDMTVTLHVESIQYASPAAATPTLDLSVDEATPSPAS